MANTLLEYAYNEFVRGYLARTLELSEVFDRRLGRYLYWRDLNPRLYSEVFDFLSDLLKDGFQDMMGEYATMMREHGCSLYEIGTLAADAAVGDYPEDPAYRTRALLDYIPFRLQVTDTSYMLTHYPHGCSLVPRG